MQVATIYLVSAVAVWLLLGTLITALFIINRPKGITVPKPYRLWLLGTVLWPFLVALMFSRR